MSGFGEIRFDELGTVVVTVLIVLILALIAKIISKRNNNPNKAPGFLMLIFEKYVDYFDRNFSFISEGKIDKGAPYIFGLANFLLIGNLLALFGLEPIASSYSVTLALALITWIGSWVIAIIFQRLSLVIKLINPFELIGRFAPLISLSFRLFGNIMGGNVVLFLVYFLAYKMQALLIGSESTYLQSLNLLSVLVMPFLRIYFDFFHGILQTYIFVMLTTMYWSLEAVNEFAEKRAAKKQAQDQTPSQTQTQTQNLPQNPSLEETLKT